MSVILNKSNHPVFVKKIKLYIWSLRDELEEAISQRLEKSTDGNIDIEDLREFYSRGPNIIPEEEESGEEDENELEEALDDEINQLLGTNEEDKKEESESSDEENSEDKKDSNEEVSALADEVMAETQENAVEEEKPKAQGPLILPRVHPKGNKLSSGFSLMSDLNMEFFMVFSKSGFYKGQTIVIELLIPQKFSVTAEVIKCENITRTSRIISQEKPNYRVQCQITYNQPGERARLREFLSSIEPDIPQAPKKVRKAASDNDDEDEFEDLGF